MSDARRIAGSLQAAGLFLILLLGVLAAAAPRSQAIGFASAGVEFREGTPRGVPLQAGGHADFTTGAVVADPWEAPRDITFDLPPGLVGNPSATPRCSLVMFVKDLTAPDFCRPETKIGMLEVLFAGNPAGREPIFNLTPPNNRVALFGVKPLNVNAYISVGIRPGDYGITAGGLAISQAERVLAVRVRIWANPFDPVHDVERGFLSGFESLVNPPAERPFLTNPTSCSETPVSFTARMDSWLNPGVFTTTTFDEDVTGTPVRFEGCEKIPFAPSMLVKPTNSEASGTGGLSVDLTVPQNEDPDGVATSMVRSTVVTFPKGMAISASSANGLSACSTAQIGIGSNDPPTCPESSKIGTVDIKSPALEDEVHGDLLVAKQKENPFGSLLAVYMAVKGPGFYLKLPGKLETDPSTGQVTTTFTDTPQLPFETLHMDIKSGPRAPFTLPSKCGDYTIESVITPWSGNPPVTQNSTFSVNQGCDNASRFAPELKAGPTNPVAGKHSPFVFKITRGEGEQNLAGIQATLPEGLLAKLKGVPVCGDAQAATGACPAGSQVGTTTVAAGEGSSPVWVPQPGKAPTAVYLAGPYKGAPYSLVVKVPAQAGPFDLGTVAVRNGLHIDPVTTKVTVKSDPLPQILEGIPIAYRTVYVSIDRDGFTLNPTDCSSMAVTSTLTSATGATANPSDRFQVGDCAALGFKPKLSLKFSGPTHRSAHPKLKAVLTMPKSGANIGKAVVTLPKTEFLENAHIRTVCTRVQYAADSCPKGSVYGYAKAWTPLLDGPLQGPVYLRSSNHTLPDLVASLDGAIHVDLAGRIDSPGGKIRNTFWAVPDAPVSKFVLTMQGGDKGLLVNNTELCRANPHAKAEFTGQNGKSSVSNPLVQTDCGKSSRKR
jgi:hypothetical protein